MFPPGSEPKWTRIAVDARVAGVVPREGGDAEVGEVDKPDVQRVRAALAGGLAVGRALLVLVPLVVEEPVGAGEGEREPGVRRGGGLATGEGVVQDRHLLGDLRVGDVAGTVLAGHHVDVDRNRGGDRGAAPSELPFAFRIDLVRDSIAFCCFSETSRWSVPCLLRAASEPVGTAQLEPRWRRRRFAWHEQVPREW